MTTTLVRTERSRPVGNEVSAKRTGTAPAIDMASYVQLRADYERLQRAVSAALAALNRACAVNCDSRDAAREIVRCIDPAVRALAPLSQTAGSSDLQTASAMGQEGIDAVDLLPACRDCGGDLILDRQYVGGHGYRMIRRCRECFIPADEGEGQ